MLNQMPLAMSWLDSIAMIKYGIEKSPFLGLWLDIVTANCQRTNCCGHLLLYNSVEVYIPV